MSRNLQITICCESDEEYLNASELLERLGFSLIVDPFSYGNDVHSVYVSNTDMIQKGRQKYVKC